MFYTPSENYKSISESKVDKSAAEQAMNLKVATLKICILCPRSLILISGILFIIAGEVSGPQKRNSSCLISDIPIFICRSHSHPEQNSPARYYY